MNEKRIIDLLDSLTAEQTDRLIEGVEMESGSLYSRRILKRTKRKTEGKQSRRPGWLVPVACAVVAITVCAAVPPVRAAIESWFNMYHNVQNYVSQPSELREDTPDIDRVIEQTMVQPSVAGNDIIAEPSIEIVNVVPEWQEWADKLHPKMGDIYFDGKQLVVSYDMGGGARELLLSGGPVDDKDSPFRYEVSLGSPHYMILNGEKYAYQMYTDYTEDIAQKFPGYYSVETGMDGSRELAQAADAANSALFATTVNFDDFYNEFADFDELSKDEQDELTGYIETRQQFDPEYTPFEFVTPTGVELKGVQQAEINLQLRVIDYATPDRVDSEGGYYTADPIGTVRLKFSFDPAAGYESYTENSIDRSVSFSGEGTYAFENDDPTNAETGRNIYICENRTVDMSGVVLTVKELEVSPSGCTLYLSLAMPESWSDEEKNSFAISLEYYTTLDGQEVVSGYGIDFYEETGEYVITLGLNMLPSELEQVDELKVVPCLRRLISVNGQALEEGQSVRHDWDEDGGLTTDHEVEVLEDYAFVINPKDMI